MYHLYRQALALHCGPKQPDSGTAYQFCSNSRASEQTNARGKVKQAVGSKQRSKQPSEWPSTSVPIHGCFKQTCPFPCTSVLTAIQGHKHSINQSLTCPHRSTPNPKKTHHSQVSGGSECVLKALPPNSMMTTYEGDRGQESFKGFDFLRIFDGIS